MLKRKKRKIKLRWFERILIIVSIIVIGSVTVKASDYFLSKLKDDSACPNGMIPFSSPAGEFCIDIYEASPSKECPMIEVNNPEGTRLNLSDINCQPVSEAGKRPWTFISQDQATLACAKAGKRLATSQEWYQAALGTPDKDSNWDENDCNVDSNWPAQPGPTGSAKNCVSGIGAYDMIGNVWEWVSGTVENSEINGGKLPASGYIDSTNGDSFPAVTNQEKPNPDYMSDYFWIKDGLRGIARGGYWGNKEEAGQYSMYVVSPPTYTGIGVGFRCLK